MGRASRGKRERGQTRTLYHFTSRQHLPLIERDGFLRPTESNLSLFRERVGPDVVWLLDTPTADAHHGLDGSAFDKRAVRIEVRTKAIRWTDWIRKQKNVDWNDTKVLVNVAGGPEAAAHWWVTEQPIPREEWVSTNVLTQA